MKLAVLHKNLTHSHFNPIKTLHKLKNAGFSEKQAEAQIEFVSEIIESDLATKSGIMELAVEIEVIKREIELIKKDIETLRQEVKNDIETLRQEVKKDIETLRQGVKKDIELLKSDLTIRMTVIMSTIIGIFIGLEKLFS
jgi:hypothetical protein